jgi:hypothetical protein
MAYDQYARHAQGVLISPEIGESFSASIIDAFVLLRTCNRCFRFLFAHPMCATLFIGYCSALKTYSLFLIFPD